MEVGIYKEVSIITEEKHSAKLVGSGDLLVFSTPSMIALMENAAYSCALDYLSESQSTVGVSVNIKHIKATKIGSKVCAKATLKEIENKRLIFNVEAYDEEGQIGSGIHERVIIDKDKFMSKLGG